MQEKQQRLRARVEQQANLSEQQATSTEQRLGEAQRLRVWVG
jgi:hypothetical protein